MNGPTMMAALISRLAKIEVAASRPTPTPEQIAEAQRIEAAIDELRRSLATAVKDDEA
jgi:hypothetical protein